MKKCIQCGACCKFVLFPSSKDFEADGAKDWLAIRGIKAEGGLLKVNMVCPKLTDDDKCAIQENKPKVCSDFEPGSIPECPLYKEGGKTMDEDKVLIDFESKSADELMQMRKEGVIYGRKTLPIEDLKIGVDENGNVFVEGYANTKNVADRYGDIPTVFEALRNYVYGLSNYQKNPVCLMNHDNSVQSIAGSFQPALGGYCIEDEKGLKVKMVFSNSDYPPVAHARTVYAEGHGRAFSIGGRWSYEDKDNPMHLTHADIYEISIVGVGADPNAVTTKSAPGEDEKGAIPYKKTSLAPEGDAWDGPAEIADATPADLKIMCAWYDSENPDVKGSYKLPHHKASGHACVWKGVSAAMGAILGARGGVDIPEADKKKVYNHLSKHYADFEKTPPEFKGVAEAEKDTARNLLTRLEESIKAGRVLSAANEEKLRAALTAITAVLASLDGNAAEIGDEILTDEEKELNEICEALNSGI